MEVCGWGLRKYLNDLNCTNPDKIKILLKKYDIMTLYLYHRKDVFEFTGISNLST